MDNLVEMVYNEGIIYLVMKGTQNMKKIISIISAFAIAMSITVNVSAFSDMPTGVIGDAMQSAVDVGLINGYDDGTVKPNNLITRAEMAAIITRAFGATETTVKTYSDVPAEAWYHDVVSKSVAMGAFEGDDDSIFSPERNITFQETYIVLSRVFAFEPYEISNSGLLLGDVDAKVLDTFADKGEIASWAVNGAKYIVGNGGWTGIDGKLKPTAYITRGEFALLMDSIVDRYIDEPGTYAGIGDEFVMVRSGGVVIDGMKSNKSLVIAYSVDTRGVEVKNSVINGVTLILGGADPTPKRVENGTGAIKEQPDESYIKIDGNIYDLRISGKYIYVDASTAKVEYAKSNPSNLISLMFNLG